MASGQSEKQEPGWPGYSVQLLCVLLLMLGYGGVFLRGHAPDAGVTVHRTADIETQPLQ